MRETEVFFNWCFAAALRGTATWIEEIAEKVSSSHSKHRRQTRASRGMDDNDSLLQGYLLKRPVGRNVGKSHRRWLVLSHDSISWYKDDSRKAKRLGELLFHPGATVEINGPTLMVTSGGLSLQLVDSDVGSHSKLPRWLNAITLQLDRLDPTSVGSFYKSADVGGLQRGRRETYDVDGDDESGESTQASRSDGTDLLSCGSTTPATTCSSSCWGMLYSSHGLNIDPSASSTCRQQQAIRSSNLHNMPTQASAAAPLPPPQPLPQPLPTMLKREGSSRNFPRGKRATTFAAPVDFGKSLVKGLGDVGKKVAHIVPNRYAIWTRPAGLPGGVARWGCISGVARRGCICRVAYAGLHMQGCICRADQSTSTGLSDCACICACSCRWAKAQHEKLVSVKARSQRESSSLMDDDEISYRYALLDEGEG